MSVSLNKERVSVSPIIDWKASNPPYVDRSVYVRDLAAPPYREYEFIVTLDQSTGTVEDSPTKVATEPDGAFDECGEEPPEAIRAAFARVRPQMVAQLEAIRPGAIDQIAAILGVEAPRTLAERVYEAMRKDGTLRPDLRQYAVAVRRTAGDVLQAQSLADAIRRARELYGKPKPSYPPELARADRLLSAEELREKYGTEPDRSGDCGEHPKYSLGEWRQQVAQRSTLLGYWQWVESQLEQADD